MICLVVHEEVALLAANLAARVHDAPLDDTVVPPDRAPVVEDGPADERVGGGRGHRPLVTVTETVSLGQRGRAGAISLGGARKFRAPFH